ncbi:nicotinamide-nucleotide amidohydrolase PncC [Escherichia coli]|uniref:Nicotinamide-nucleotide amidohydrolase PncC n=10 Tax=root TaxID=1 RepID=A0A8S0FMH7_ECOLX|nr:nicotinamide-nucleotide amidohydrolase PncC [Escherichia coli]
MTESELMQLSEQVGLALKARGATVTTAESCTGGWVAKVITDIAGSSAWFERGFVTYSNEAKACRIICSQFYRRRQMIGVREETLAQHGAVSEPVVVEMAIGALKAARADYAVSISGIAGPDGGSEEKPVGTVWFAFATARGEGITRRECFSGDRDAVRRQATAYALQTLWQQFLQNT